MKKVSLSLLTIFIAFCTFTFILGKVVYAQQADVNVSATVSGCLLDLIVKPEKRIPRVNNWGTIADVSITNLSNTVLANFTTTTNNLGKTTIDLCSMGINLSAGNYNFFIRGYSHLMKKFSNIYAFNNVYSYIDLSSGDQFLMAGETSKIYDNYINSLDISTQISTLFTGSYKNDLNQDSIVNSLDIANTITNFFLKGD
jgi:hypothetical protein